MSEQRRPPRPCLRIRKLPAVVMINPPVQNMSYNTNTPRSRHCAAFTAEESQRQRKESTAALFRPPPPPPVREPEPRSSRISLARRHHDAHLLDGRHCFRRRLHAARGQARDMPAPAGVESTWPVPRLRRDRRALQPLRELHRRWRPRAGCRLPLGWRALDASGVSPVHRPRLAAGRRAWPLYRGDSIR